MEEVPNKISLSFEVNEWSKVFDRKTVIKKIWVLTKTSYLWSEKTFSRLQGKRRECDRKEAGGSMSYRKSTTNGEMKQR